MPLGQFRDTFIIAVDAEGIAIVDQHVAHERVLYEQVMERLTRRAAGRAGAALAAGRGAANRNSATRWPSHGEHLTRLGFSVEPFGG